MTVHAPVEPTGGQQKIGKRIHTLCGRDVYPPTYTSAQHLLETVEYQKGERWAGWGDYCLTCRQKAELIKESGKWRAREAVIFLRDGWADQRGYTWALVDGTPRHVTAWDVETACEPTFDYRSPTGGSVPLLVTITTADNAQHEIRNAASTITERTIAGTYTRRHGYVVRSAHSTGV